MSPLSEKQIQAQVAAIRRSVKNGAQHIAIRSPGAWKGERILFVDEAEHLVIPCVSDLQVREALIRAELEKKPAILLCSIGDDALGEDVVDRLAKRRVHPPQVRDMVAELFAVSPAPTEEQLKKRIDPRVLKNKVLMAALVEHVPPEGYPPVASGTLDLQTAWTALISQIIGERVETPSLTRLLEWSLDPKTLERLAGMRDDLKQAFIDWFTRSKGETVRFMMAAIDSGFGAHLVPLGLSLGIVFDPMHYRNAEHQQARGRLERYFQHRDIDEESAHAWFRVSRTLISQIPDPATKSTRRALLNRVDEFVATLGLSERAWISNDSPLGLDQRYRRAGEALRQALDAKKPAGLETIHSHLTAIREHILGGVDAERLSRVEMAYRLIQWLRTTNKPEAAESFEVMVTQYHQDGGFIDWARNRLKETDESQELQKAYDAILKMVENRSDHFEATFAKQLREWTRSEHRSSSFTLIENVLEEVVTPVAKQRHLLLLVLDGMSVAVFRQLLQNILQNDWAEIINTEAGLPRPVIATLPSVTAISRRALFLGRLDPATSGTEEGEFKNNELLFQGSGSQVRPKLFKMGDLSDESSGGIASSVREAMGDKKCRIVSVVLNAIDDHLDSGKQVDFEWTRNTIRGLRNLLRQAADSGRIVIMTSDHGHVLDFGTKQLNCPKEGRGDRFRPADGKAREGELEFDGSRIRQATGSNRMTLACSAHIRYGGSKRGYHGGANPQEVVVPLAVLSSIRNEPPEEWAEAPSYQPAWWQMDPFEPAPVAPPKAKIDKAIAGLELFEQAAPTDVAEASGWVRALLQSPIYKEQSKLAVRGAPADDLMEKLLGALDNRGGTVVKQALAQELGMPPFRVDGLIQNVSRILNVDGYEIIAFDRNSDAVTLNVGLLRTQFSLENDR